LGLPETKKGMTMTFKSRIKEDALNCLLNTDEFAEEITYTPAGGQSRIIKALVDRDRKTPDRQDDSRTLQNQAEIFVLNDETLGISQINEIDDRIILSDSGGSSKVCRIVEVLAKDDALWHLLAQW